MTAPQIQMSGPIVGRCVFCAALTTSWTGDSFVAGEGSCWDRLFGCGAHYEDLRALRTAYFEWVSKMVRRASGALPPLPSSMWAPTPESTP